MTTLYDLGQSVIKIRETINTIEVKGEENASRIVFAIRKCNEIITAINESVTEIQNKTNEQVEEGVDE